MPSTASDLVLPRPAETGSPASVAAQVGARDLLVFRQVTPGRFLHLGGHGRGAGWAGNIELDLSAEPALQAALDGAVVRWSAEDPCRVLGPYYSAHAALLGVDHDVAVLIGWEKEPTAQEPQLRAAAARAVDLVGAVTPAKRLADELEVLSAVRQVMQVAPESVDAALEHVARTAAEALGCEVAVAWDARSDRVALVERDWSTGASPADLPTLMRSLAGGLDGPVCRQDSLTAALPAPLSPAEGVRSSYLLPLGSPADGLLLLCHTVRVPRGFTALCRTVGERTAEAAGVVVHSAVMREELQRLVVLAEAQARQDCLTGVANRLGWEEAVARVAPGGTASVLVVDLNGLKAVNDVHGHDAGDRFVQRAARTLQSVVRDGDTVARLGGDEFGVLLPDCDPRRLDDVMARLHVAIAAAERTDGTALSAAVGGASCPPAADLRAAIFEADARMYADKAAVRGR